MEERKNLAEQTPPLLSPPIIETIYEIQWEMEKDESAQRMRDPSYPTMYGALYERLKKELPIIEDLPSNQAHPEATPYIPRHRMRKGEGAYPLVQIGPGVLTINHSFGYSWQEFQALIKRAVSSVYELFPKARIPLNLVKSELRFVNAIHFDMAKEGPLTFLSEKMHLDVGLDPEFYMQTSTQERPNAFALNLSFALDQPVGNLGLSVNLGNFDQKPAFIQQTIIQSVADLAPQEVEGIEEWLEKAHTTAESAFQFLYRGSLMNRFLTNAKG